MTQMETVFGGTVLAGAAIGLVAACWSQIKVLALRAVGLLVVRAVVENEAGNALIGYLWRHYSFSRLGQRRFSSVNLFVRPIGMNADVAFEAVGTEPLVCWRGWRPLVVRMTPATMNSQTFGRVNVQLSFLRGTFDLEAIVSTAVEEWNNLRHGAEAGQSSRFRVQTYCGSGRGAGGRGSSDIFGRGPTDRLPPSAGDGPTLAGSAVAESPEKRWLRYRVDELGAVRPADPYLHLAFPPDVLRAVEDVRRWKAGRAWYESRQIPWRRGLLLTGKPGTGKTSLARAMAQEHDLPLFRFDLGSMDNRELTKYWGQALLETPCMVLLEDIDAVFKGRDNRLGEEGGGLTFDCLLNCISGVEAADGLLLVVTTNHPEDLDPALGCGGRHGSTRPGRIDQVVELLSLDEAGRRAVAARILRDCPDEIDRAVLQGTGDSGAQFTERCARVALDRYWAVAPGPADQPLRIVG